MYFFKSSSKTTRAFFSIAVTLGLIQHYSLLLQCHSHSRMPEGTSLKFSLQQRILFAARRDQDGLLELHVGAVWHFLSIRFDISHSPIMKQFIHFISENWNLLKKACFSDVDKSITTVWTSHSLLFSMIIMLRVVVSTKWLQCIDGEHLPR